MSFGAVLFAGGVALQMADRPADAGNAVRPPPAVRTAASATVRPNRDNRYSCRFTRAGAIRPLLREGRGAMLVTVNEATACVNRRSLYERTPDGVLRRVALFERENRASILTFSPDRRRFSRRDFQLDAAAFRQLHDAAGDLAVSCAARGGPSDQAAAAFSRATENAINALPQAPSRLMNWNCSAQ